MALIVHQFRCLEDNYGFLARDEASGQVAVIDTPDADTILAEAQSLGWPIHLILNTHWHPDHAGGNAAVQTATGARIVAPEEVRRISNIDEVVAGGDLVALGETKFQVLDVGGHTVGHIALYDETSGVLFAGDTLFPMGCGRIFEGTAEQMWASLSRLAALPGDTMIYSAHEYTLANARFAASVDDSAETLARLIEVELSTQAGQPTVPTTMSREWTTNPFLKAPALRVGDPASAFAALRLEKDNFTG